MTRDNQSPNLDERLSAFTDQVLDGQADDLSAIGSDLEMRALAETVLRLKRAFPKEELNRAAIQRLQEDVLVRWRDERQKKTPWLDFFRMEWLMPPQRTRLVTVVAWAAVAAVLIVALPMILLSSDSLTASAGSQTPMGLSLWIFLGILVVALFWLLRRKL
jgi:hypothetical protein